MVPRSDIYLSQYKSKSKNLQKTVPGAAYFDKVCTFVDLHVQI